MACQQQISFHESTVRFFSANNAIVELGLEDVLLDGKKVDIILKMSTVSWLSRDREPANSLGMEADDGEVLTLDINDEGFTLIIEWHDFKNKKSSTKYYEIYGNNISIEKFPNNPHI